MKKIEWVRKGGVAAVLMGALFSGAAFASPGGACGQSGPPPGMNAAHAGMQARAPLALHGLNLTPAQQQKISDIQQRFQPRLRHAARAMHAVRNALREQLGARYDDAKAHELSNRIGKLAAQLSFQRAREMHEILGVLTPAQRNQLKAQRPQPPRMGPGPGQTMQPPQ